MRRVFGAASSLAAGRKVSACLRALPLVLAAWILARACALAVSPFTPPAAPAMPPPAAPAVREFAPALPPFARFAILESNNLFGLNDRAPEEAAPSRVSAPRSLNAFLMGTVDAPLPEDSRAVIQHEGTQYVLRPGQDVAGFVLREIRRGAAVFAAGEHLVELRAEGSGAPALPENAARSRETPPRADAGNAPPAAVPSVPAAAAALAVPEMRDMIRRGILAPNEDKSGLVVRKSSGNLILNALKLREGDVITGVNGKPASIMGDSRAMMRELETGALTIAVTRDGAPESLTLHAPGDGGKQ